MWFYSFRCQPFRLCVCLWHACIVYVCTNMYATGDNLRNPYGLPPSLRQSFSFPHSALCRPIRPDGWKALASSDFISRLPREALGLNTTANEILMQILVLYLPIDPSLQPQTLTIPIERNIIFVYSHIHVCMHLYS